MRSTGLIAKPDTPLTGFIHGACATAGAVGIPLIVQVVVMAFAYGKPLVGFMLSVGITCAASLAGGLALATWRLVQGWMYERFSEGPPN